MTPLCLFPEGIYNLPEDRRPTILSQLNNRTGAESPFVLENPRWPLKNNSGVQRWGAGGHSSLMSAWDFWLRLTSQTPSGFSWGSYALKNMIQPVVCLNLCQGMPSNTSFRALSQVYMHTVQVHKNPNILQRDSAIFCLTKLFAVF